MILINTLQIVSPQTNRNPLKFSKKPSKCFVAPNE